MTDEFRINTYTNDYQGFSKVAVLNNGGFVVTWFSRGQDGSGDGIYAQQYNADGTPNGGEFLVNASYTSYNQFEPDIEALADGGYVIAWQSEFQDRSGNAVIARHYDSAGNLIGDDFQINDETFSDQARPSISARDDGGFVVTWMSNGQDGDGHGIFAKIYEGSGGGLVAALDISVAVADLDGSESIESVVISGVPTGASLSAGTDNGDGAWTLALSDLQGLSLSLPASLTGDHVLTVTATSQEVANGDTASSAKTFTVTIPTHVGTPGDDILIGGSGDDIMIGGAGNDTIDGGANGADSDTVSYFDADDGVRVDLSGGATGEGTATSTAGGDAAGIGDDILIGIENIEGSDFDDILIGDAGANTLDGDFGNDLIIGGAGSDNLEGGLGDDLFVFSDGGGADNINDFTAGAATEDVIDLIGETSINSFADVQAATIQVGVDTVIDLGNGDQITLLGVNVNDLHQDDFLF